MMSLFNISLSKTKTKVMIIFYKSIWQQHNKCKQAEGYNTGHRGLFLVFKMCTDWVSSLSSQGAPTPNHNHILFLALTLEPKNIPAPEEHRTPLFRGYNICKEFHIQPRCILVVLPYNWYFRTGSHFNLSNCVNKLKNCSVGCVKWLKKTSTLLLLSSSLGWCLPFVQVLVLTEMSNWQIVRPWDRLSVKSRR